MKVKLNNKSLDTNATSHSFGSRTNTSRFSAKRLAQSR